MNLSIQTRRALTAALLLAAPLATLAQAGSTLDKIRARG